MQTTRRKILDHLEANAPSSAKSISQALQMTVANIRHHINRLEEDGFIEIVDRTRLEGRGRPTLLYGLTIQASKTDLRQLTSALWTELLGDSSPDEASRKLQKLAIKITAVDGSAGGSLTQRLYQAVRRLRGLSYDARWEAHAQSPLIILQRCPYAAIQMDLPEICTLDREIIAHLIGQPIEQISTRNNPSRAQPNCVFRVIPQ